jgi:hypothetical protein
MHHHILLSVAAHPCLLLPTLLLLRCRAQAAAAAGESKDYFPTDPSMQPGAACYSATGLPPASMTCDSSNSKLESSKYSYNTQGGLN